MIEGQRLAALVASKVCHDMVEPMSALLQGLEMLKENDTAGKNADAILLLETGVNKAWAKLDFFRSAFAGGLGGEGVGQIEEAKATADRLFGALKPTLVWSVGAVSMPRAMLKVFLNLLWIANECLPRGGTVTVEADPAPADTDAGALGEIRIIAVGPRAAMRASTRQVLGGETPEDGYQAYNVQPALTGILARQAGVELLAREADGQVELIARSAQIMA